MRKLNDSKHLNAETCNCRNLHIHAVACFRAEIHADRLPEVRISNKPFLKQIFAGKFDTDMLTYPEMENNTEWHELEAFVKPYEELFSSASTINLTADQEVSVGTFMIMT